MQDFFTFQYLLLQRILLTASFFACIIALASWLEVYLLHPAYTIILFLYGVSNIISYIITTRTQNYYIYIVHVLIFFSLIVLSILYATELRNGFRLAWFFIFILVAYMLGGKQYGRIMALLSYVIIMVIYLWIPMRLSLFSIVTFSSTFLALNLFINYFLSKIELDHNLFEYKVEEEVKKRQRHEQLLLRKHRMAHMGEMIDTIAHQWRQPLANANMILLNMEEELDNKVYIESKITELSTLNTHMSQTIDDFRHLLHDSKNKTTFELHIAIEEVLALMNNQLKDVEVQYTNRVNHQIVGYKNELIQVLITLLSNAVEALEQKKIQDKKVSLMIEEHKETFSIHIEDNAGGIKSEVLHTLFEPYVSTKKAIGGTGLGLYIAKLIVEDVMHGRLSFSSGQKGARFTMEIQKIL